MSDASRRQRFDISRPGDRLEHEADRAADSVLRGETAQLSAAGGVVAQRKCCDDSEELCPTCALQRSAEGAPSVHPDSLGARIDAARGGGRPLALATRARMEPAFGFDFGAVRVHAGGESDALARSLGARAFTVGSDIFVRDDHNRPGSPSYQRLMAHELAHIVQQRGVAGPLLQRDDDGESWWEKLKKTAEDIAETAGEAAGKIAEAILTPNMAKKPLGKADKDAITKKFKIDPPSGTGTVAAFKEGPRFILHDTAAQSTGKGATAAAKAADLEKIEQAKWKMTPHSGTPVGEGPSSYVTALGSPIQSHPKFYLPDRPTATAYEKVNDMMDQLTRETNMQTAWGLTAPAEQKKAIDAYLARFPTLTKPAPPPPPPPAGTKPAPVKKAKPSDVELEETKARKNLDPTQSPPTNDPKKIAVFTTATGAVTVICDKVVAAKSAAGVAVSGKEKELEKACGGLDPMFTARKARVASGTNLEISREAGSDCETRAGKTVPFAPYPSAVYDAAAQLYLSAAQEIGQFPEITTHYFLDTSPVTKSQNRCDPRCFRLDDLYSRIAATLSHSAGTTYGIPFIPGTKWGTSTIWWHDPVCGTNPTAPPPAPKAPAKEG